MGEVQFVDTSKDVKKTLAGLSKTALREGAKVATKIIRANINTRSKRIKNHIAYWARIDYKTGQPICDIGFQSAAKVRKRGKKPSHANPHWIEFGVGSHTIKVKGEKKAMAIVPKNVMYGKSVQHPGTAGTHILRNSVYDNISEIRAKQTELLTFLNDTLEQAGSKVVESEEVEDD